jgi:hypothetical protein
MRSVVWASTAVLFGIAGAMAHSFIPPRCCGDNECFVPLHVEITPNGYIAKFKFGTYTYPWALPSQDGRYWGCFNTAVSPPVPRADCFYAPNTDS